MKNAEKLKNYVRWMGAKHYAKSTIDIYEQYARNFLIWADEDSIRISNNRIQQYIFDIPKQYSYSYRNQVINAVKLYYRIIEGRYLKDVVLPRPKCKQYIPVIPTIEQIKNIIFNTLNLKHMTILFTIYDNGLRIQELINLRWQDLRTKDLSEGEKPTLKIENSKGNKTRIIPVSDKFMELIKKYWNLFKTKFYIFEGPAGKQYSKTSIRNILNNAIKREAINIHCRVHDLRHAFATHSLAKGTNLKHMSDFLGHKSVKTTESIYIHLLPQYLTIQRSF